MLPPWSDAHSATPCRPYWAMALSSSCTCFVARLAHSIRNELRALGRRRGDYNAHGGAGAVVAVPETAACTGDWRRSANLAAHILQIETVDEYLITSLFLFSSYTLQVRCAIRRAHHRRVLFGSRRAHRYAWHWTPCVCVWCARISHTYPVHVCFT